MSQDTSLGTMQFRCYVNGREKRCSFAEAMDGFRASNIGYLVQPGFYRYKIDGYADEFFFSEREIQAAESEFAFELHRRRCTALTLDDIHTTHDDGRRFQQNTLAGRASRFFRKAYAAMPQAMRPYQVIAVPGTGHKTQPGYLLRSGITCFMVVDQVWSGSVRPYFDWSLFLESHTDRQLRTSA